MHTTKMSQHNENWQEHSWSYHSTRCSTT